MLACGNFGMSVNTFMIEDAVLQMLNKLQQRLAVFSAAFRKLEKSMGDALYVYEPQQAILRAVQTMPVVYVSRREK